MSHYRIIGTDVMLTRLFEGTEDHLAPSTERGLLDSELFVLAGRVIGRDVNN